MYLEIALVLLSAAVFGIALMVIPLAFQVNRFIKVFSQTLEQINRDLPKVLQDVEDLSANLRTSSFIVRRRMEAMDAALGKLQMLLSILSSIESLARPILKLPMFRFLHTTAALLKGLRVFTTVLMGEKKGG